MKHFLLIILAALQCLQLMAQDKVTLTGRISGNQDSIVYLQINYFSLTSMAEEKKGLAIPVNKKDNTFFLQTHKIDIPNSICFMIINYKVLQLILSPGDSLHIETDFNSVQGSAKFSGIGAGKNQYGADFFSRFIQSDREHEIRRDSTNYIKNLKILLQEELNLVASYYQTGKVDSLFAANEFKSLRYSYYVFVLINYFQRDWLTERELLSADLNWNNIDFNDQYALISNSYYRWLIKLYVEYLSVPAGTRRAASYRPNIRKMLDNADERLQGPAHSLFIYDLLKGTLDYRTQEPERTAILKYALSRYKDPNLVRLLHELEPKTKKSETSFNRSELWNYAGIILIILSLVFAITAIVMNFRNLRLENPNKSPNIGLWTFMTVIMVIFAWYILFITPNEDEKWLIMRIFILLVFFGLHTFWLIPSLLIKRRYISYGLVLVCLVGSYLEANYMISWKEEISLHSHDLNIKEVIGGLLIKSLLAIIFSLFSYFSFSLIKKTRLYGKIHDSHLITPELVIHVFIVLFLLSIAIIGQNQAHGARRIFQVIILLSIFYVVCFYFIPRYIYKKKYVRGIILSLGFFILIILLIVGYDALQSFQGLRSKGISSDFLSLLRFPRNLSFFAAIIPALIYAYIRKFLKMRFNQGFVLADKKEAELNQLRSQVNPHFLFNSLNAVYSFALQENSPKTAEYIDKLSSLMRYLIDDMDKDRILVEKEIDYIRDYINLQKIRSSIEPDIEINTEISEPGSLIAPMLMIPFVENAFKHGVNPYKPSEIKILILVKKHHLTFEIENTINQDFESLYKEKGFGYGIENVRQRLANMYPDKHSLEVQHSGESFRVKLVLDLV